MSNNARYQNYRARETLRLRVASLGQPCALCGRPIDYSLPNNDPWSYELDEDIPIARGGSPIDPNNVQASHRFCNQQKGTMTTAEYRAMKLGKPAQAVQQIGCSQNW